MTTLFDFYKQLRGFVEGHRMINKFKVIGSIEEVDTMNVDARSLFISVESSNISHRLNTNKVTFALFVVDKCLSDDQESLVISMQENLFVVGQVQDFILSLDNDVEFEEVSIAQAPNDDYNLTAAVCSFEVDFDKNISCTDYSLNSSYVPTEQSLFFEDENGNIRSFFVHETNLKIAKQLISMGNVYFSIEGIKQNCKIMIQLSNYQGESHTIEVQYDQAYGFARVVNENVNQYFTNSAELRVRVWQEDSLGNKYVNAINPVEYAEDYIDFLMFGTNWAETDSGNSFYKASSTIGPAEYAYSVVNTDFPYHEVYVTDYTESVNYEVQIAKVTGTPAVSEIVYTTSGNTSSFSNEYEAVVLSSDVASEIDCSAVRFYPYYREEIYAFDGSVRMSDWANNGIITVSSPLLPNC